MCAKADYWSEQDVIMWRLVFAITFFLAILATLVVYFNNRGAADPVAELPEWKVEPTTTISARP